MTRSSHSKHSSLVMQRQFGAFEESGNPFSEDSQVLVVLDSKEVMHEKTVSSLSEVVGIGQSQYIIYEKCVDERVKQLSIPISNIMILKNKVSPFHESFTNQTLQE